MKHSDLALKVFKFMVDSYKQNSRICFRFDDLQELYPGMDVTAAIKLLESIGIVRTRSYNNKPYLIYLDEVFANKPPKTIKREIKASVSNPTGEKSIFEKISIMIGISAGFVAIIQFIMQVL